MVHGLGSIAPPDRVSQSTWHDALRSNWYPRTCRSQYADHKQVRYSIMANIKCLAYDEHGRPAAC